MNQKFDAFISYSHAADRRLAKALQDALHRFAKPIYRLRTFRVFRDESTLALTPALWPEIQNALELSGYLLLLADPLAATSPWVQKETTAWLELGRAERTILIWTGGEIVWDSEISDFDWSRTNALPRTLSGAFKDEPLYLDLRWAKRSDQQAHDRKDFGREVARIAATLRGVSLDEIFGEDVRQLRMNRLIRLIGFCALLAMSLFAGWRYLLEREARQEAIRQGKQAQLERDAAEEQARIASTRLALTLHERELVESEERGHPLSAFLIAAQAAAAAPNEDFRRDLYRLRTLYLALLQPQAVHQLGRPIKWIVMPQPMRWISFSKLPLLDVWDTHDWHIVRTLNVDPEHKNVTDVSPCPVSDSRELLVAARDPENASSTYGIGNTTYERWDIGSGKMQVFTKEISDITWYYRSIPCRGAVSIQELEQLRQDQSSFPAVLKLLLNRPDQNYLSSPPDAKDSALHKNWWIDAISPTGEFIVATFYDGSSIPEEGTWNGSWLPKLGQKYEVSAWRWDGHSYRQSLTLKYKDSNSAALRSVGFGDKSTPDLLWVIMDNGVLSGISLSARWPTDHFQPIPTEGRSWVQITGGFLNVIDAGGRISIRDLAFDDGTNPAGPITPPDIDDGMTSQGGLYTAKLDQDRLFISEKAKPHRRVATFPVHKVIPHVNGVDCGSMSVRFRGSNEIMWCEEREVNKWKQLDLTQGSLDLPAERSWTIKRAIVSKPHRAVDLGSHLDPDERFIAFASDGQSFLAWDYLTNTAFLHNTDSGELLGAIKNDADDVDLFRMFFSNGTDWRMLNGSFTATWSSGVTVTVGSQSITMRSGSESWSIHDPRKTVWAQTGPFALGNLAGQDLLAVSHSGRLLATAARLGVMKDRGNYVRLWDASTGEPLSPWLWHDTPVLSAAFSDDGWLWTFSAAFRGGAIMPGGTARRWPADTPDLKGSDWIDVMAEPVSGMHVLPPADAQPIGESELQQLRARFKQQVESRAGQGLGLAKWFRQRMRPGA